MKKAKKSKNEEKSEKIKISKKYSRRSQPGISQGTIRTFLIEMMRRDEILLHEKSSLSSALNYFEWMKQKRLVIFHRPGLAWHAHRDWLTI
jgi:hypothetical protein